MKYKSLCIISLSQLHVASIKRATAEAYTTMDFEQLPGFAECKLIDNKGDATKKAFVQSRFRVNKWSKSATAAKRDALVQKNDLC